MNVRRLVRGGGGEAGASLLNYLKMLVQHRFIIIVVIVMVMSWTRPVIVYVLGMRAVTLVVSYKIV